MTIFSGSGFTLLVYIDFVYDKEKIDKYFNMKYNKYYAKSYRSQLSNNTITTFIFNVRKGNTKTQQIKMCMIQTQTNQNN